MSTYIFIYIHITERLFDTSYIYEYFVYVTQYAISTK